MTCKRSAALLFLLLSFAPATRAASPVDLLQDGLEALLDERYEDAKASFERALQLTPSSQPAKQGLKRAQEKLLEKQARLRAGETPALNAAKAALKRKDWMEASDQINGVLARQSDHPEALALQRDLRERLSKSVEKAKKDSSAWYDAQGALAYLEGDWLKAVSSWDQVLAFNPDRVDLSAGITRAKARFEENKNRDRLALLQAEAWDNLRKSDFERAVQNWEEILTLDPNNGPAQDGLAEARRAWEEQKVRRKEEEAQKMSEKAMELFVDRKFKESTALWRQILALDPANDMAKEYLRRIQWESGMAPSGGGAAPAVQSVSSGYQKAMDYLEEGRYPEALETLERQAEKTPDDARVKRALEDTRAKQRALAEAAYQEGLMTYTEGKIPDAIRRWQDALRVDPNFQRARQAIIKAMQEQRRQGGAGK